MSNETNEHDKNSVEKLLAEFSSHSEEKWREAVDKLLKGKPYEKIMLTKTYEDIELKPIYSRKQFEKLLHISELPGFDSNTRNNKVLGYHEKAWNIAQEIPYTLPEDFNKAIIFDLNRGQNSVNMVFDKATLSGLDPDQANYDQIGTGGSSLSTLVDMETALKNVSIDSIDIDMQAYSVALPFAVLLAAFAKKQNIKLSDLHGSIGMDPISELMENGSICLSENHAYWEMYELIKWASSNMPDIRTIAVHTHVCNNSGASAVEELAVAFSTAVEYLRKMIEYGLDVNVIAPRIQFNLSIGSNFFMEIAKFRAARLLWSKIIDEFEGDENSKKMYIHAKTSNYNKTRYDIFVNILRTTTEAFSAVLGSVDSLHIGSFDDIIKKPDEFSRRIARNQHLILKEECHFDQVIDPAGGSWYIENLTALIAEKTWENFQEIERKGGILTALTSGMIQNMIEKTAEKREKNFFTRKDIFVGINMYANVNEKLYSATDNEDEEIYKKRLDQFARQTKYMDFKLDKKNIVSSMIKAFENGATLGTVIDKLRAEEDEWLNIKVLKSVRLADSFENLRDSVNKYSKDHKTPQVFFANFGTLSQYKARAEFSRGFFEVAGFDVIDVGSFNSSSEAAEEALKSEAKIVVICSNDSSYPDLVPQFSKIIKENNQAITVVLAGYPIEQIDNYKEAGVDIFIHLKANAYEILSEILKKSGVLQ